jgi:hypothetical protein
MARRLKVPEAELDFKRFLALMEDGPEKTALLAYLLSKETDATNGKATAGNGNGKAKPPPRW